MPKKKMSVNEMRAEVAKLEKQIEEAAYQEALNEITASPEFDIVQKKLAKLGTTPDEITKLFTGKRKASKSKASTGVKVPPKYRYPENPKLVWTGRGRKPKWVEECLEKGLTLEQLLIKK